MIDAEGRAAAVSGAGSVLVQAPAGSGKTTLLVQRFLRLLSRVDVPEGILALTFTRRAAQEMRERVIEALRAARQGERPHHINTDTWDLALRAARHLAQLNLDVETQPGRLRIETIDAFNAWLAAQLPITAGAAGLRVLPDARQCYAEAARRTLSHEGGDVFGAAVERVLALDDQRWRALVKLIAEMLPSRDRWLPLLAGRLKAAAALDAGQLLSLRAPFRRGPAVAGGAGHSAGASDARRRTALGAGAHSDPRGEPRTGGTPAPRALAPRFLAAPG